MQGWILLHRSITENPLWQDKPFSKGQAWIDLLLMANHAPAKLLLGNKIIELGRGQFHTSELKLAEKWGWSRKKVRAYLNLLDNQKMATTEGTTKGTTVTIEKYSLYQDGGTTKGTTEGTTKEQRKNNERTTKGTQTKNVKNVKNEKEIYKDIPEAILETVKDFEIHRKSIKKPMTEKAMELMLKKLNRLSEGDIGKSKLILEQSIQNGWTGIYQLKEIESGNPFKERLRKELEDEQARSDSNNVDSTGIFSKLLQG